MTRRLPRAAAVAGPAALVLLGLVAWGSTLRLPLTGVDIWPILAHAAHALDDPGALWRERYLQGFWEGARFWRPGYTAYTALGWSLFGDNAVPWHALRLVAALAAAAVAGSSAALQGRAPRLAWFAASAFYLLHPVQAETLPVTSRDADTLFTLAVLGGLYALARGAWEGPHARPGLAGLGVLALLLAPTIKEPGLLGPALGVVALAPWRVGTRRGFRLGLAVLLLAGLTGHVAARFALIGTIGAYERELPVGTGEALREITAGLFDHQRLGPAFLLLVFGLAAAAAGAAWRSRAALAQPGAPPPAWRALRDACAAWLVVGGMVFVTSPVFRLRYAEALLAPVAVLAGGALSALLDPRMPFRGARRVAPVLLLGAALLAVVVPGSPLLWRYPQWETAGRAADIVLDVAGNTLRQAESAPGGLATMRIGRFEVTALVAARAGVALGAAAPADARGGREATLRRVVRIDPFPFQPAQPRGAFAGRVANVAILAPYAVEGYLHLRGWPRGTVEVQQGLPLIGVSEKDLP